MDTWLILTRESFTSRLGEAPLCSGQEGKSPGADNQSSLVQSESVTLSPARQWRKRWLKKQLRAVKQ